MRQLWLGGLLALYVGSGTWMQAQEGSVPEIFEFVAVDREPEILNLEEVKARIPYPYQAIKEHAAGMVVVRMLIDAKGKYVQHRFVNKPNPMFEEAIVPFVPLIRFSPAISGGKPLSYFWVNVPFRFELNQGYRPMTSIASAALQVTPIVPNRQKARELLTEGTEGLRAGNFLCAATQLGWSLRYQRKANTRKAPTLLNFQTALNQGISLNRLGKGESALLSLNLAWHWASDLRDTHPEVDSTLQVLLIERAISRIQGGGTPSEAVQDFAKVAHLIADATTCPDWKPLHFEKATAEKVATLLALAPDVETSALMAWVASKLYCQEGYWTLGMEVLKSTNNLNSVNFIQMRVTALMDAGDYLTALNELEDLHTTEIEQDVLLDLKAAIINRITLAQGR